MTFGINRWRQLHSRAESLVGRMACCQKNIEHEIRRHPGKEKASLVRADVNGPFEERRVDAGSEIHRRAPRVIDGRTVRHPEIRPGRAEWARSIGGKVQREPVERDSGCDVEEGARDGWRYARRFAPCAVHGLSPGDV